MRTILNQVERISGKEGTKDGGPSGDHTFFLHCVEQNWKDQSLRQSSENLS